MNSIILRAINVIDIVKQKALAVKNNAMCHIGPVIDKVSHIGIGFALQALSYTAKTAGALHERLMAEHMASLIPSAEETAVLGSTDQSMLCQHCQTEQRMDGSNYCVHCDTEFAEISEDDHKTQ